MNNINKISKYNKIIDHDCKEEWTVCLTNDRGDDSALGEIDREYE